jgi:hypothetical protein
MRGPLACVLFYNTAHSSAQKAAIEALLFGTYAITPTGVTPITVTRAGAVRDVGASEPENIMRYSESPSNAAWTKTGAAVVVAGAAVGPDGVTLADQLTVDGPANATASVSQSTALQVPSTTVAPQLWIKRVSTSGTVQIAAPAASANGQWNVDLSAIGSGWVQIKAGALPTGVTQANAWVTNASGQTGLLFRSSGGSVSFLVAGIGLNVGATPGAYVRTYADARPAGPFVFPVGDNARIAHPVKGLPCFLAATNLLLQSETLDNVSWYKTRATVTANATAAPDRATTAEKLVEDTSATTTHFTGQNITKAATATQYTLSIYAKAGERGGLDLVAANSGFTGYTEAFFNLSTGVVQMAAGALFTGASGRADYAGNGWWRCSITFTTDTDTTLQCQARIWTTATNAYTGDGASGIYVWGAQLETGAFAGPYVPTTTASASSAADVHRLSSAGWPTSSGEIELAYTPANQGNATSARVLFDSRTQFPGDGIVFYIGTNGVVNVQQHGSNTQVTFASGVLTWNAGQVYRFKYVWNRGVGSLYLDGVSVATNGSLPVPTTHHATPGLGCDSPTIGAVDQAQGHIRLLYVGKPRP